MKAQTLLAAAAVPGLVIPPGVRQRLGKLELDGVTADSRRAGPNSLFVALTGAKVDGHDYVSDAVARGCRMVLTTCGRTAGCSPGAAKNGVLQLAAPDTREAFGRLCAAFNGHPARKMLMIGITGTNGKTTSSYLLEDLVRQAGGVPGVIGTVNYRYRERVAPAPHTTPEPETLHRLLGEMAAAGVSHLIMEVSSHALEQRRVAGIEFDVALFTNLSHDHLDYHGDMNSYYASKKRLFSEHLKPDGTAVVVAGDLWNERLAQELLPVAAGGKGGARKLLRCGFSDGELRVLERRADLTGVTAKLGWAGGEWSLRSSLVGEFNLFNLLGVAGVGLALGYSPEEVGSGLAAATPPPGRLERFSSGTGIEVFVDYAHTPDALSHVLKALRPHAGRLVVIFGCGGDRDRGKRPVMGEIAGRLADIVILTSDNPRGENPAAILAAIEEGVRRAGLSRCRLESLLAAAAGRRGYDLVESRRRAIRDTLLHSRPGDLVLLCGKGHETTQVIGSTSRHFDDRQEVVEQLAVVRR